MAGNPAQRYDAVVITIVRPHRCPWCLASDAHLAYHDNERGVPVHDDRKLFELLILEGAQASGMVNDHLVRCFRHAQLQEE